MGHSLALLISGVIGGIVIWMYWVHWQAEGRKTIAEGPPWTPWIVTGAVLFVLILVWVL